MPRKKFSDLAAPIKADPVRAARVAEYGRAIDAALALAEIRKEQELTQTEVAEVLGVSQVNVSRIEREDDPYVSTLRRYVEALGGRLEVQAVFDDRTVTVDINRPALPA
jgi:DNA-binding XRE family transcriptional regulator